MNERMDASENTDPDVLSCSYQSSSTIWLFNIAMENPLQMEVFMGKSSINGSFSIAMLIYQRVYVNSADCWGPSKKLDAELGTEKINLSRRTCRAPPGALWMGLSLPRKFKYSGGEHTQKKMQTKWKNKGCHSIIFHIKLLVYPRAPGYVVEVH